MWSESVWGHSSTVASVTVSARFLKTTGAGIGDVLNAAAELFACPANCFAPVGMARTSNLAGQRSSEPHFLKF